MGRKLNSERKYSIGAAVDHVFRPLNYKPLWALGDFAPQAPREWRAFGGRLEDFIVSGLGVQKQQFARALGISPTTLSRWLRGQPLGRTQRNLLGHLVRLSAEENPIEALAEIKVRRHQYEDVAPGDVPAVVHQDVLSDVRAQLQQLRDDLADVNRQLVQLWDRIGQAART